MWITGQVLKKWRPTEHESSDSSFPPNLGSIYQNLLGHVRWGALSLKYFATTLPPAIMFPKEHLHNKVDQQLLHNKVDQQLEIQSFNQRSNVAFKLSFKTSHCVLSLSLGYVRCGAFSLANLTELSRPAVKSPNEILQNKVEQQFDIQSVGVSVRSLNSLSTPTTLISL